MVFTSAYLIPDTSHGRHHFRTRNHISYVGRRVRRSLPNRQLDELPLQHYAHPVLHGGLLHVQIEHTSTSHILHLAKPFLHYVL